MTARYRRLRSTGARILDARCEVCGERALYGFVVSKTNLGKWYCAKHVHHGLPETFNETASPTDTHPDRT